MKKLIKIFTFAYCQGQGGWSPTHYGQPDRKISLILTTFLREAVKYYFADFSPKKAEPSPPLTVSLNQAMSTPVFKDNSKDTINRLQINPI